MLYNYKTGQPLRRLKRLKEAQKAQRGSRGSKRPKENQDTQKWLKEAYKAQADTKGLKVQIDFTDSKETQNAKTGNKRQSFCHSMGKLNLLNH